MTDVKKQCSCCKQIKPASEYYKSARASSGLNSYCIQCHKANNIARKRENRSDPQFRAAELIYKKQYRANNQESIKQYMQEWRANNPNRAAEYHQENISYRKEYAKNYRQNNKAKINAKTRKRQAAQINRTPLWLSADELWLIQEIYDLAVIRTNQFGFSWHVDHIVPLQGKLVSGLHVPENLQVIPAIMNIKKHNLFEVKHGVN